MSIYDPISYADWYWKHSVDALRLRSEQAEQSYAPIIQQLLDDTGLSEFMPDSVRPLFHNLTEPTEPDFDSIGRPFLALYTRALGMVAGEEIARPTAYALKAATPTLKIDADIAAILTQRRKMTEEVFKVYASFTGYDDNETREFYKSRLPYPSVPDIITASRYLGDATNPKPYAMEKFDIPEDDFMIWDWLTYQKFTTEQVLSLHRAKFWDDFQVDTELARLGWRGDDSVVLKKLAYEIPNSMLLVQGSLVRGMTEETIIDLISRGGIHPDYAHDYLDAILTKPATEDIIAYELRQDPSLSRLGDELSKIGVHNNYHGLYKELAYQIPPVADIITMAVREAFTPDIAARFGQYQDLPSEFVEWVGKKGLSKEWAERYWAAHWSLPSPQQGFEMLHRGVIGEDDVNMLMRALDIMPYWRDKLIQIAYRPFSRVDVRRMYALGVIDTSGIRKAYRDIGYNEYNADLMTKFTIAYTQRIELRAKEAKERGEEKEQEAKQKAVQKEREAREKALIPKVSEWTTAQTLKFFTMKLISEERAREEFELLGYNEERINVYIASLAGVPD
ncbi:hypothetical protein LCGC14_1106520 [marine sediment metagenome]|uniref:Uncharacterized protein n=1 Tax=marine sediment metagenome TaxID=412755 RepID=A0A0F9M7Y6_9ZZZZ